jgi:Fe2+ transport system protein FeoA
VTLDEAGWDVPLRVSGFAALDALERSRLSGLGIRPGAAVIKLMPTPLRDPVECQVGPQLLALERRLLRQIEVEPG